MQRANASTHSAVAPLTAEEEELRRVLQQGGPEVRRSRNAIGRMRDYLGAAETFLAEGGPWRRLHADAVLARRESPESSYAFLHELGGLRGVLNRVGLKVAGESRGGENEAAERAEPSAEVHRSTDPQAK